MLTPSLVDESAHLLFHCCLAINGILRSFGESFERIGPSPGSAPHAGSAWGTPKIKQKPDIVIFSTTKSFIIHSTLFSPKIKEKAFAALLHTQGL